jgi:DNA-binding Xre family transcriptional regulator
MSYKTSQTDVHVKLTVVLNDYLDILRGEQAAKPPQERISVPNLGELAEGAGLHRVTVTNLANNHAKQINVETISAVVNELRRRGFAVKVQDILDFR